MRSVTHTFCALSVALVAAPAAAEAFEQITTRDDFVAATSGRDLTRFGISVAVSPSGDIKGRAFGYPVTGAWNWQDGYFCRDLYWGGDRLDPNCQAVRIKGDTIRFISDQGTGQSADLTLK
ncbi:dihydrodipicolinate reductase [Roseovarius aquimarinus]|uniref:Dihydrodipicolinate reductase n=1 Tax=Roseovarius aquimarinus TaxID=1229156 RepID=A0ABW7I8C1_9RHOB